MIKKLAGETWKSLEFKGQKALRNKYAISSQGRVASYNKDLTEDGKLLKGSVTSGYRTLNIHADGKSHTLYVHREVAKNFLPKPGRKENIVVHLNHDKQDNRGKNLRWVSLDQSIQHQQKSPARKAFKERQKSRTKGLKLTAVQARAIKSELGRSQRKLTNRQLAQKYDVSEMTIYRIQRGESWGNS